MGTNYYARIIPKEEDKQKLKDAIDNDRDDLVEDLVSELYSSRNEYTRKGNKIHLGKRSAGWKFLWNPNVIRYCDGYIDQETKEFIPVWKYDQVYPLTKQGITDFCNREDVIITDEYGETFSAEEFLEMAFSWGQPNGLTGKTYEECIAKLVNHLWQDLTEAERKQIKETLE
jgi:TPP-dependent indolepyruvate ferredoxin oxidoreductase alpha subunit